ncbi:MAG TPA: amino acid deaminase [Marmoricola sp.]|nr:amino acid deaminase [Marmoricola sp.]
MTLEPSGRTLDPRVMARLSKVTLTGMEKSMPHRAAGHDVGGFLASSPRLSEFSTPLLVLTDLELEHNLTVMSEWCAGRGLGLAPHGKTTMAPALWERQLAAGAWGISLATPSQLRVAVEFGVRRIQLANALVDPPSLRWVSSRLDDDPELQILSWVDSPETVAAMEGVLAELSPQRPLTVLIELGAPGGRTGARTVEEAKHVARAVSSSRWLRLAGVSGYEGALAHDASDAGLHAVRGYLEQLAALHRSLLADGEYAGVDDLVVTAGGSAYFDEVADALGPLADPEGASGPRCSVLLRSGAYIIHDDGFYRMISPLGRTPGQTPLRSAMHAWARVVSRPQPGLALLDAGKRDVPFDEGLPEPQLYADQLGSPTKPLTGARVTAVNDQHAFLELDPDGSGADLRVGQVVRLGLSHPCTAFDKWRMIPVLPDSDGDDPVVVDLVQTFF